MLGRAVSSVCRQSFEDFELIIIDDGSKQFSSNLLPRDPRILVIRNSCSLGVAQARNLGIQAAKGTYISYLDDDDEYLHSFLSSTYASLRDTPEQIGISWCGAKFIHYPSKADQAPTIGIQEFAANKHDPTLLQYFLSIGTGHGVTMKASCLKTVGPFNAALRVASDTDMFLRILKKGYRPLAVPGVHIVRHDHRGSRLTSAKLYRERIRTWEEWLFIEHSEFLDQHPQLRSGFRGYVDSLKHKSPSDSWMLSPLLAMRSWLATAHRNLRSPSAKVKKQIKRALPARILNSIMAVRRHTRKYGYFPNLIRP
jgi:glycosyltransferase involved in cell wall biosynthesis